MIPILYLSHCGSSIGGGEKQLAHLVENIDRSHYQPLVVCPDDGVFAEYLRSVGIPTVVLGLPSWRKAKSLLVRYSAAKKLAALAEAHEAKLIHTSDSWFNPYLWHLRKRLKIPAISHVRTLLTSSQVKKYRFNRMDSIVAISERSKNWLIRSGIDAHKVAVILNCVNLSDFRPAPLKTTSAEYVVGIVGRIEPFKRQKLFIEIAARVAAQTGSVRFYIVGAALDTPDHRAYNREVHELVAKYQLHGTVHFMGHRTDMPEVMQGLDLLVTLSAGSVIAEAMAAGTPVLGTAVGSASEMIVHGVTGYIMPPESTQEIADKIMELATDRRQSAAMGQRARKYAEGAFSVETHVQKVQEVYEYVLGARGSGVLV